MFVRFSLSHCTYVVRDVMIYLSFVQTTLHMFRHTTVDYADSDTSVDSDS